MTSGKKPSLSSINLAEVFERPSVIMTDRRQSTRFPIERQARYRTLNQRSDVFAGIGKTLNISSSGVLFTSAHELPPGTRVEVLISWAVALNEKCLLDLVALGPVARYSKGQVAIQIEQYKFSRQSRARAISL